MKTWLIDFLYHLTGKYTGRIIECKSYKVIQYLKQTNYKGEFYDNRA